jgi:hypothetical protein
MKSFLICFFHLLVTSTGRSLLQLTDHLFLVIIGSLWETVVTKLFDCRFFECCMSTGEEASRYSSGVPCRYGVNGPKRKRQCESTSTFPHTVLKLLYVTAKVLM